MTTEKQKEYIRKYLSTEKGKEANRRNTRNWILKNPEKAKESYNNYIHSEKGKEARARANRRYREKLKQKSALLEK